jgi:plasmid stabilization system protein ParE
VSLPLEFHPAVRRESDSAFRWYERQRPGLGTDFLDSVEQVLAEVTANPTRFASAERDIREAALSRFPYAIYYRVLPDRIRVLAVYHLSRDPTAWQSRT